MRENHINFGGANHDWPIMFSITSDNGVEGWEMNFPPGRSAQLV